MKIAIMQPYFFPYLGYFQLINVVDKFVVHDDVQYIKGGWINKNRILLNNDSFNIGIPVKKDSAEKDINERYFIDDCIRFKSKVLRQIENAYNKAPFFENIFPVVKRIFSIEERNVSKFNIMTLSELCNLLEIKTPFYISSEIKKQENLSGEERVININQIMNSKLYINLSGGTKLYHKDSFLKAGVDLKFIITENYFYKQFDENFKSGLSIIDALMFNSPQEMKRLLSSYRLVENV